VEGKLKETPINKNLFIDPSSSKNTENFDHPDYFIRLPTIDINPASNLSNRAAFYKSYDTPFLSGCGFGENARVVQDITESDLALIGKLDSHDIYELKDPNHKLNWLGWQSKIASVPDSMWSEVNENSAKPTYENYLKKHPLIFLKDPWDRWIVIGEHDYLLPGGCGKPVIYLYPEKPTDVFLKFNAKVDFTNQIPKYVNGWSMQPIRMVILPICNHNILIVPVCPQTLAQSMQNCVSGKQLSINLADEGVNQCDNFGLLGTTKNNSYSNIVVQNNTYKYRIKAIDQTGKSSSYVTLTTKVNCPETSTPTPTSTPNPTSSPTSTQSVTPTPSTTPAMIMSPPPSSTINENATSFGIWTPTKWDTCTKDEHGSFFIIGPDGKRYPTWHPPTTKRSDGTVCTFGHEHGRDPHLSKIWPKIQEFFAHDANHDGVISSAEKTVSGLPFGYVNGKLTEFNIANGQPLLHRHEDHVGHKVEWEGNTLSMPMTMRPNIPALIPGQGVPIFPRLTRELIQRTPLATTCMKFLSLTTVSTRTAKFTMSESLR
jgi:hypothetical protein